jgi:hypothetical protein
MIQNIGIEINPALLIDMLLSGYKKKDLKNNKHQSKGRG